jgi:AcrR family transcriptional regulator
VYGTRYGTAYGKLDPVSSPLRTASSPSSTRAAAPRGRLSRERITEAALALIERDGLEALTMRRLAEELGIGTMTLYGYFRDKEELLDALVDTAAGQLEVPSDGGTWKSQIRALMEEIRRALVEHPVGVLLRQRRPMWSPGALRISEAGLRTLREAGFSKADAARAYRSLFNYTFGFAAFSPHEVSTRQRQEALAALASLPRDRYPTQIEAAAELADAVGGEVQFRYGLDLLLDGLEAKLGRPSGPS